MSIEFERAKLYEEVWSEALTKLGERYGLSDNGLRKICKAMNIPLPKVGHWAKVAAGHKVEKTPLPPDAERTSYVANPPVEEASVETPADREWREEATRSEELSVNQIDVDFSPRRWHPVLVPFRDEIRKRAKDYVQYQKELEQRKRGHGNHKPFVAALNWISYQNCGLLYTHKAIPIRTYIGTYERALVILNTFLLEAEKRGYTVAFDDREGRFILTGHGVSFRVRLVERLVDVPNKEKREGSFYPSKVKEPTGELRLYLEKNWSGNGYMISDEPDRPLEARLNFVFSKIYQLVVRLWIEQRRDAVRQEVWNLERRRRAEEQARLDEIERLRNEERKRRRALLKEALNWERAERIRKYVAYVEGMVQPTPEGLVFSEWKSWALGVASDLAPWPVQANLAGENG